MDTTEVCGSADATCMRINVPRSQDTVLLRRSNSTTRVSSLSIVNAQRHNETESAVAVTTRKRPSVSGRKAMLCKIAALTPTPKVPLASRDAVGADGDDGICNDGVVDEDDKLDDDDDVNDCDDKDDDEDDNEIALSSAVFFVE